MMFRVVGLPGWGCVSSTQYDGALTACFGLYLFGMSMQLDGVLGGVIAVAALCSLIANLVWAGRYLYRRAVSRSSSAIALINDPTFLQAIFDHSPAGTIVLDAANANRAIVANREWYREFLLDPNKVAGATALEMDIWVDPKDRERLLAPLELASSSSMIDAPLRRGDGGVSWYQFSARRVLMGGRDLIICSGQNVDAQRETEQALRASSVLFSQIFDLVPEGLVLTDARNRYQNVNRAWLERTGYTREQVIGRTSKELNLWPNPVDPLLLRETMEHDGQVNGIRVHARMADGSMMLGEIFGRRFQSHGETIGLWLSRDITEREHISQRLQQKQQQLEQILSLLPEPVIVTDSATGRILEVNPAWESLLGHPREEALGRTTLEVGLYFGDDGARIRDALREPLRTGGKIDAYETRLRHADGHVILAEVSARAIAQEGHPQYVYTVRDVTESRRMLHDLQESKDMLAQIFDIVPEAIAITEKSTGHVLSVNRFWEEKLGYIKSAVLGKTANELKVWVDMAAVASMGQRFAMQGQIDAEPLDIRRFDGSIVHMEVSARQMELQARQTTLWVFRDVSAQRLAELALQHANANLEQRVLQRTQDLSQALSLVQRTKDDLQTALLDLRHTQDRLVQSEKMGSMGTLLIGVAHELNTPLGNALTTASNLQHHVHEFAQALHTGDMRRSQLEAFVAHCRLASDLMERNTARAAKLVATFKQLAVDRTSLLRSQFSLAGAVAESVREVAQSVVQRHVHIRQWVAAGIVLDSYREALTQVLTNLLQNAVVHAMQGDQPLTITLQAQPMDWQERPAVSLVVSDDGVGMEQEVAKRAFDPYFTTRLGQGGSGLGLYQVYNLVHSALGGTLHLDSTPGQGTRITIILPLSGPEATQDMQRTSAAAL